MTQLFDRLASRPLIFSVPSESTVCPYGMNVIDVTGIRSHPFRPTEDVIGYASDDPAAEIVVDIKSSDKDVKVFYPVSHPKKVREALSTCQRVFG